MFKVGQSYLGTKSLRSLKGNDLINVQFIISISAGSGACQISQSHVSNNYFISTTSEVDQLFLGARQYICTTYEKDQSLLSTS